MSRRIDRSWTVFDSVENGSHDHCVDLFRRPDGSFGFETFRRDVEDGGAWTPLQFHAGGVYSSPEAALAAACRAVPWLDEALAERRQKPKGSQSTMPGSR